MFFLCLLVKLLCVHKMYNRHIYCFLLPNRSATDKLITGYTALCCQHHISFFQLYRNFSAIFVTRAHVGTVDAIISTLFESNDLGGDIWMNILKNDAYILNI